MPLKTPVEHRAGSTMDDMDMFIMSKFTVRTANADAEAVIEEFLDALEAMSIERFLNVWHDDGVQIMPYAPEELPARFEGKEAIRRYFGDLLAKCKTVHIPSRVFHFTNDSNRVWVEFYGEIQIKATGKTCINTYVCLFTLRDGRIVEYKEYFNPLIYLNAFGGSKEQCRSLSKPPKK
jgi:ketosteroid isomerase-like protein